MTIALYQMAKVGSSSVWQWLLASGCTAPMYKLFYVSESGITEGSQMYGRHIFGSRGDASELPHLDSADEFRRRLRTGEAGRVKVISLARDPVARDVSGFLHFLSWRNPDLAASLANGAGPRRLARGAAAQFFRFDEATNYTCTWFDREIKEVLGIDVFESGFDRDAKRLLTGDGGRVEVLVLRTEDLEDPMALGALSEFIGVDVRREMPHQESIRHRLTVDTSPKSEDVFPHVRIPRDVLELVYSTKFARHFYDASEREALMRRWSRSHEEPRAEVPS